jgi:hypothetical protein
MDSPVMALSSTLERPSTTSPSTGIFVPGLTSTISSTPTSCGATSTCWPSRRTRATGGASSSRFCSTLRVYPSARASRYAPKMNRKVTAAASQYSPMTSAPVVAIVTSSSMLNWRLRRLRAARSAISDPASSAAAIMKASRTLCKASARSAISARMIKGRTANGQELAALFRVIEPGNELVHEAFS